jgi:dihydrolipoamide dehydrogenase
MSTEFDLIVIGAGPGGYVAAVRGAQLGMRVAIVEKRKTLGGTCLNVGCIPSKALLDSSEHFHQAKHAFRVHGIEIDNLRLNLKQMMKRKDDVVQTTTAGIEYLMKKNKVTRLEGVGRFVDSHTVAVSAPTNKTITGASIIIATGSEPTELPFMPFDGKHILSSDEAISLKEVPGHLIVIGGGVIGVEIGSVFARLGSKVSVVEFMDGLLPTMDRELGKSLQRSLKKLGFEFYFKTKVTGATVNKNQVTVSAVGAEGQAASVTGDVVLVAVGRRPFTKDLGLDKAGVSVDDRGRVAINDHFQTSAPHIYAIGDVVKGPMLAHKASEEGVACVEYIAGQKPHLNYNTIPGVVYTWPEVASVGKSEEELKTAGLAYRVGNFPFKASGRARAAEESEGFVKVLVDATTDEIVGVHMIGPRVSDMIGEGVVAMEYRASAEDIGAIIHAHPTFSEALKEAALMATGNRAIHI